MTRHRESGRRQTAYCRANRASLTAVSELARDLARQPEMQPLADKARRVADEPLRRSQQALSQAGPAAVEERDGLLEQAEKQLSAALEGLEELDRANDQLTQERLERELTMSPARVSAALAELVRDGVIESQTDALGSVYRIPANEPTTIVIERLFNAARVDQNLRRIVVAHMAHGHAPSLARQ